MIISAPVQNEISLTHAKSLLKAFDVHKNEFKHIPGCSLNRPKIHAMQHYLDNVREYGVPGNYDTEYTEHQHIQYAKLPYKMTNRRDAEPQMLRFIYRRSVVWAKYQYLESIQESANTSSSGRSDLTGLGSKLTKNPISIDGASRLGLGDLEVDLRIFLHNCMYPDGEGRRHRVKKRNLPELDNIQVFHFCIYLF